MAPSADQATTSDSMAPVSSAQNILHWRFNIYITTLDMTKQSDKTRHVFTPSAI